MDTNDTDILGNFTLERVDTAGIIEGEEDEGEPNYIGFIESSIIKMVPKFLKALVTLLICGMLLLVTFILIKLGKRGCRTHRKLHEEKARNGRAAVPLHSVIVTPPDDDEEASEDASIPNRSNLQPGGSRHMKVPKQTLRRASGVFGSEALSFVGEQYTMKKIEKDRHYYKAGHVPGHFGNAHHFRSGSSAGGTSPTPQNEESAGSSRWNCFKSSN